MTLIKQCFYISFLLVFLSPSRAMMSSDPSENEEQKTMLKIGSIPQRTNSLVSNDSSETNSPNTPLQSSPIEKMASITQYTNRLADLASSEKWEEILGLTKGASFTLPQALLRRGILIQSYFNYVDAVSKAYQETAKKAESSSANRYYKEAIALCSQYLEGVKSFQAQRICDKVCSLTSQQFIYIRLGEMNQDLFFKLLGPSCSPDLPPYLWKAIKHYKSAISCRKEASKLFKENNDKDTSPIMKEIHSQNMVEIGLCKTNIFNSYIGLIIELSDSNLQARLFTEAKEALSELKEDKGLYRFSRQTFQFMEKEFQAQTLAKTPGRIGEKVRLKLMERLRGEASFALSHADTVPSLDENLTSYLTTQYTQFLLLSSGDNHEQALSFLQNMEYKIRVTLEKKDHFVNGSEKEKLKKICESLLTVRALEHSIDKIMSCFLNNNDIDGALFRAQAFSDLEQEKTGAVSWSTRTLTAFLKNLTGDHKDWLEIENIVSQKKQEKQRQNQIRKTKAHQKHVTKIKKDVKEKESIMLEEEQKLQLIAQKKHQEHPKGVSYTEGLTTPAFDTAEPSSQQQCLEKIQRHENALKQREEAAASVVSQPIQATTELLVEKVPLNEFLQQEQPLGTLYLLKGLSLTVDQEIERNTWNFKRDDLKHYFETLGCVYKSGKGSHTKINLPKAMHVTYGDKLITLFNTEGGALTLPQWNDKVPHYLRKQILIARQKIVAVKSKKNMSLAQEKDDVL